MHAVHHCCVLFADPSRRHNHQGKIRSQNTHRKLRNKLAQLTQVTYGTSWDSPSAVLFLNLKFTVTQNGAALFSDPAVKSVLSTLTLGANKAEIPKIPSLVYQWSVAFV